MEVSWQSEVGQSQVFVGSTALEQTLSAVEMRPARSGMPTSCGRWQWQLTQPVRRALCDYELGKPGTNGKRSSRPALHASARNCRVPKGYTTRLTTGDLGGYVRVGGVLCVELSVVARPDAISICGLGWWRNHGSKVLNRAGWTWRRLLCQCCIFPSSISFLGGRLSRFYLDAMRSPKRGLSVVGWVCYRGSWTT